MKAAAQEAGSLRTCVATRAELPPDEMIRFVLAPDGTVTPDLKRKLPGRGVWVTATAQAVAAAAKKNAFARSFKAPARVPDGLADRIEELMAKDCLQALALANKAGLVTTGFAKVEALVEKGEVVALLHAADGGADGKRKLGQALRRRFAEAAPAELETFGSAQMDLALGRSNVIHAALRSGPASAALIERCARLRKYRAGADELDCANAPSGPDEGAQGPGRRTE